MDGALGFWKVIDEVFPGTWHQRCWVHKTSNVLSKVPKSIQPAVKSDLRDIWQAETRADAEAAVNVFAEKYGVKYEKAATCPTKDREALLAFYDYPAEHWDHLRTANPPSRACKHALPGNNRERVRHGQAPDRADQGCPIPENGQADGLQARPGRLEGMAPPEGANKLPMVIEGVKFIDGVADTDATNRAA